jgi:hypothetical protein
VKVNSESSEFFSGIRDLPSEQREQVSVEEGVRHELSDEREDDDEGKGASSLASGRSREKVAIERSSGRQMNLRVMTWRPGGR